MCTIIGSKNGEKIECSPIVEEKKLNVVPKKIFVCDCYFDFGLKWRLQKPYSFMYRWLPIKIFC